MRILHLLTFVVRRASSPIHFLVREWFPLVFGIVRVFWLPSLDAINSKKNSQFEKKNGRFEKNRRVRRIFRMVK